MFLSRTESTVTNHYKATYDSNKSDITLTKLRSSLVQMSKVDSRGRLRNCRIHDLLREVLVKKMESSFCHVVDGNESIVKGEIVTRRLSIVNNSCTTILQDADQVSQVRIILNFNIDQSPTLLNYIFNPARMKGIKLKEGFGSLKTLEKLYDLDVNEMGVEVIEELGKLMQLRRLRINNFRSEYGRILGGCIEKMNHLESLDVNATSEDDVIDLESMSSPPQFLQRLYLSGRLMKLPEWIKKLQNLTAIFFNWSKLEDDSIQNLKNLPNLLVFWIQRDAYVGDELQFEKGMFTKLKELDLTYLSGLERVEIEEGSLVNLESLEIGPSPQLKEVPSGIQHLKNLQYLCFYDTSMKFMKSMLPGGQHYKIVQHVPRVRISYTRDGGKYETFRLF
ncbi:disease resistance protein RPM1-like [Ziziphus jujuba]|uniref:Disease resistance protein RPM1-like n=1 Tax=Ziziphus jujuba TaxID=326968 RepID=A0ABM4AEV5_ZIZJJ|nr:disease resistance protein RPM1-like [Ziziphus jujuba]